MGQLLYYFWVDGKPVTKGSWSAFRNSKTGRINFVGPKGLVTWQKAVHDKASQTVGDDPLLDGALVIRATFYLGRPKSVEREYPYGERDGDVDKYLRAILDALTGVMYKDDAQVIHARATKIWAASPKCPMTSSSKNLAASPKTGVYVQVRRYHSHESL
jgi:Holliday junction resolvase RusA-like endonuclease